MKHRRGKFVKGHRLLAVVENLGIGFDDIFAGISHEVKVDLVRILVIGKCDDGFLGSVGESLGGMRHILQLTRRVSVRVVYVKGGFEIILHSVGDICLAATGTGCIIGRIFHFFAEIVLVEASVVAYAVNESGVVGLDNDVIGGIGSNRYCAQQHCCQ